MRIGRTLIALSLLLIALAGCGSPNAYFTADFEDGLSEWVNVQALPGRIEVVEDDSEGSRVGRFEVRDGDEEPQTGSERAEVISGLRFEEGDVRYFRILTRVESWDEGTWGLLWQIHDETESTPPLSLQIVEDGDAAALVLAPGDGEDVYWQTDLPEEEWFELALRVEFGERGSVSLWFDGESQTLANGESTIADIDTLGEPPSYDKIGIYRSGDAEETAVVFHDGYTVTDGFFSDPPR